MAKKSFNVGKAKEVRPFAGLCGRDAASRRAASARLSKEVRLP